MALSQAAERTGPRESTRILILDAAERLFGAHGLDNVSLRQIATEAGAANPAAVQYHFGDKTSLLRAMFEYRVPNLDSRRGELLTRATLQGQLDSPQALLDVLLRPIAELRDSSGRLSYASLLLAIRRNAPIVDPRHHPFDLGSVTRHVVDLLYVAMGDWPAEWRHHRLYMAGTCFLDAVVDVDRKMASGSDLGLSFDTVVDDAVRVATAVLMTPLIVR